MKWTLSLLVAVAIAGCMTTTTYVQAPPPPCMSDAAKLELATQCEMRGNSFSKCTAYGSWLREYIRWRTGVFGDKLCRTERVDAE